ncbi:receptor-type tyrosine-protein phosphatase kappa-like [Glandiceps talaboti]
MCAVGFIGLNCQSDGLPSISTLTQDVKANSGHPTTFTCVVQDNVHTTVTIEIASSSYSPTSTTGGLHPNYVRTHYFNDVSVTDGENVKCIATYSGGTILKTIEATAFVQPVLRDAPLIENIETYQVTVKWNTWQRGVDIGDGPIEKYEVWYKKTSENDYAAYPQVVSSQTVLVVDGLSPYTDYMFAVRTYRPGEGGDGALNPYVRATTKCDSPLGRPNLNQASTVTSSYIQITWETAEADLEPARLRCNEVASYTVYFRINGSNTEYDTIMTDSDDTGVTITELNPCTAYELTMTMDNMAGSGPSSNQLLLTTRSGIPPKVSDLTANVESSSVIRSTWSKPENFSCPLEGYELVFEQVSGYECGDKITFGPKSLTSNMTEHIVDNLYPHTDFSVTVIPFSNSGMGSSSVVIKTTREDEPSMPLNLQTRRVSDTEIKATWNPPKCPNGILISYVIHYWETDKDESTASQVRYILNSDVTTDASKNVYYKIGELMPNTNYTLQVVAENSCCTSIRSNAATADTKPLSSVGSSSAVISGSVVGVLVLVLLVLILSVFVYLRRTGRSLKDIFSKQRDANYENATEISYSCPLDTEESTRIIPVENPYANVETHVQNVSEDDNVTEDEKVPFKPELKPKPAIAPKPDTTVTQIHETATALKPEIQPIKIKDLVAYIKRKNKSETDGFKTEYKLLPPDDVAAYTFSLTDINKPKNRFRNVLAYDRSRVILVDENEDSESDYINASYINGYKKKKAYIATQGPKIWTIADLWKMVWQEKSTCILMATNLNEKNKEKCAKYWPDQPEGEKVYDAISVKNVREEVFVDSMIRTFHVKKVDQGRVREIKQFHFTVWPDMGVPQYPSTVLAFLRRIRAYIPSNAGPLVVHCSAGVGRTGTFITIDSMLEMAEAEGKVDIFNFVYQARQDRMHFVQTSDQYEFIYSAVLEATVYGNTEIETGNLRMKLTELKMKDKATRKSALDKEFRILNEVSSEPIDGECSDGREKENFGKNRYPEIIPIDRCRPLLTTPVDIKGSTDYINASFLTAYTRKDAFLATQMPMSHTIVDFWRMVYDYQANTIVMLNDMDSEEMRRGQYWCDDGIMRYGPFEVEVLETEDIGHIVERSIGLTLYSTKKGGKTVVKRTITHLQLTAWPSDKDIPDSTSIMSEMLTLVEKAQQQSGDNRIAVHCRNGLGRSGVFCAFVAANEKIKMEQIVNVFQAVKTLRDNRPQMVETLAQYEYIYDALLAYLDSFATYANFE